MVKNRRNIFREKKISILIFILEKQQLLSCFKDDTLKLIDLRQNKTIYTFTHDNFKASTDTTKAILSPDGLYACVGCHDGSLVIWNTLNKQCESVLKQKHTYEILKKIFNLILYENYFFRTMVTSVAWQPDGNYVASCEKHRRVIIWSH